MAEVVHTAAPAYIGRNGGNLGKEYAGIAAVPLGPLGQGIAGPPPRERREHPKAEKHRVDWSAGPGGPKGYGAAVPRKFVLTGGIRNKQLEGFVGAADHAAKQEALQEACARPQTSYARGGGPDQKEAAVRSAERAMRPWSAYAGNGGGHGANFGYMVDNPPPYPDGSPAPPGFDYPGVKQALAIHKAAKQVKGKGAGQMNAEGAYSCQQGHRARELWPRDIALPPQYCAGCRGQHDPAKERNPAWEPYTPAARLKGLNLLGTRFTWALERRQLCVTLNDGSRVKPVRWTWRVKDAEGDEVLAQPANLSKQDFVNQLALMFDGLREGHEPYRHLATEAVHAFLRTHSPHLKAAATECLPGLRLALQTYEPSLAGHALLMLQCLIHSHHAVGRTIAPHISQLLPAMALLRPKHFVVHLPPPFCVGPAGSFSGNGMAPEAGRRRCHVCNVPVDKEYASMCSNVRAANAALANPHLLGEPVAAKDHKRHPLKGRSSKKYHLSRLIDSTLDLLVQHGGKQALQAVKSAIPTYSYFDPKD
eukprot:CAMPEP_0202337344 /NCGR_PEP_ID=MMETSP1126-20121109/56_1 /ASSEMBLY_ACC=CAM_ASM_000457 /TAXON_ID=3047 /ORGANISM="Dunaliella tertiolecta, Strain CCMP1320" /LENGTH=534 /DNA_ID=CAMNT_0048927501 /DNA_START=182 /DNA_END=1787 /DNA_ORIENTATION=-